MSFVLCHWGRLGSGSSVLYTKEIYLWQGVSQYTFKSATVVHSLVTYRDGDIGPHRLLSVRSIREILFDILENSRLSNERDGMRSVQNRTLLQRSITMVVDSLDRFMRDETLSTHISLK